MSDEVDLFHSFSFVSTVNRKHLHRGSKTIIYAVGVLWTLKVLEQHARQDSPAVTSGNLKLLTTKPQGHIQLSGNKFLYLTVWSKTVTSGAFAQN